MMLYNEDMMPASVLLSRPFDINQVPHVLAVDFAVINQGFQSLEDDFNNNQNRGSLFRPNRRYNLHTAYRSEQPESRWHLPRTDVAIIMATPEELPPEFINEKSLKKATQDADGTYDDSFRGKGAIIIDGLLNHGGVEDLEEQLNQDVLRGMIFKQFDAEADRRVKKMERIMRFGAAALTAYAFHKLHPSLDELKQDVKIGAIGYGAYKFLSILPIKPLQNLLKPVKHFQTGVRLGRKAVMGNTEHFKKHGRRVAAESFFDNESDRLLDEYRPIHIMTVKDALDQWGEIPECYTRTAHREFNEGLLYSWENKKSTRLAVGAIAIGVPLGLIVGGSIMLGNEIASTPKKPAPEATQPAPAGCSSEALQTLEHSLLAVTSADAIPRVVGRLKSITTTEAEVCSIDAQTAELKTGTPILFRPTAETPHGATSDGTLCYGISAANQTGATYDAHVLSLADTAPQVRIRASDQTLIICNAAGKTTEIVLTLTQK